MYQVLLPMEYPLTLSITWLLYQEKILLDSTDTWDLSMQKFQQSKISIGSLGKKAFFVCKGWLPWRICCKTLQWGRLLFVWRQEQVTMGPATAVSRYHQQFCFFLTDDEPNLNDHDFPNPSYLLVPSGYFLLTPKEISEDKKSEDEEEFMQDIFDNIGRNRQPDDDPTRNVGSEEPTSAIFRKDNSRDSTLHVLKLVQVWSN